jgi:A/G-specific adenine glycosylase
VFTHFPLELTVYLAQVPRAAKAPKGARWVKLSEAADEALPTVMRKVLAHALGDNKSTTEERHVRR